MNSTKIMIPTYAVGYVFNADPTGLTHEETQQIDRYLSGVETVAPPDGSPYFTHRPPFGLACDVYECDAIMKEANG